MARLDHGQVDIELGGESVALRPTLGAMQAINRKFGGMRAALERVQEMDFDAVAFILSAATGRKDVSQLVFEAGVSNAMVPAVEYLASLLNPSGREPKEDEGGDGEGKG